MNTLRWEVVSWRGGRWVVYRPRSKEQAEEDARNFARWLERMRFWHLGGAS